MIDRKLIETEIAYLQRDILELNQTIAEYPNMCTYHRAKRDACDKRIAELRGDLVHTRLKQAMPKAKDYIDFGGATGLVL